MLKALNSLFDGFGCRASPESINFCTGMKAITGHIRCYWHKGNNDQLTLTFKLDKRH